MEWEWHAAGEFLIVRSDRNESDRDRHKLCCDLSGNRAIFGVVAESDRERDN